MIQLQWEQFVALFGLILVTQFSRQLPVWIPFPDSLLQFLEKSKRPIGAGIMVLLVLYCWKGAGSLISISTLPRVFGSAITAGVYLRKRNFYLAIIAGTISYAVAISI